VRISTKIKCIWYKENENKELENENTELENVKSDINEELNKKTKFSKYYLYLLIFAIIIKIMGFFVIRKK